MRSRDSEIDFKIDPKDVETVHSHLIDFWRSKPKAIPRDRPDSVGEGMYLSPLTVESLRSGYESNKLAKENIKLTKIVIILSMIAVILSVIAIIQNLVKL